MTRALFLIGAGRLDGVAAGDRLELDGDEGRHAASVRRIAPGERVDVADGAGRLACCEVLQAGRGSVRLRTLELIDVPEPSPRMVLIQGLAKGGRDELAVETATEFGVDVVVPWQAGRSVAVWRDERARRGAQRWRAIARAAAKQSRRARVPEILEVLDRDGVRALLAGASLGLVLHEGADLPLSAPALPPDGDVLVVVGPEGGIEPAELKVFAAAGALAVRLGPTVLRSSSAGPAALAVLAVRTGRW